MFVVAVSAGIGTQQPTPAGEQRINLAEHLSGKQKAPNHAVTKLPERLPDRYAREVEVRGQGVHIEAKDGSGNVEVVHGNGSRSRH
jgi:hypothetical protein